MPKILVSIDGQDDGNTYYEREMDLWFLPPPGSTLELLIGTAADRLSRNAGDLGSLLKNLYFEKLAEQ